MLRNTQIVLSVLLGFVLAGLVANKHSRPANPVSPPPVFAVPLIPPDQNRPGPSGPFAISTKVPGYISYDKIIEQLNTWHKEAPTITEVGTYGKTSKGRDIYYIRTCARPNAGNPKVMITACIHGNEWIANATVMGILGTMLSEYGKDPEITKLLEERDVYWVPVVCPDSYTANSRHTDGVDPNRNFPYPGHPEIKSVPPITAIREFFLKHQFKAALSGHAFGSMFLFPNGYTPQPCPDDAIYQQVTGHMAQVSGYKNIQCRKVPTAEPYHGFELDWYYANGAFGMVCEFAHEFKPSAGTIQGEVNKTYKAFMIFIREAPVVQLKGPQDRWNYATNLDELRTVRSAHQCR